MTASRSARAIKFYLAESTNKSGFGRLSMGSNWSVLQERSYYSEVFCHMVWMSPDRQNLYVGRVTSSPAQVDDTTGCICGSGRLSCESFFEISHAPWRYTITVCGSTRAHFTRLPDSRKSVDLNDVQSSLSRRAEGSPGQKSTDSSKCC